jgi:hypothetical protein
VAFEALSARLALGPLCPAPDNSNFNTAWRRFRTDQSKQHPCQTAVHSKHAGHAIIIEGRARGRSFVVVRRLTAKRRRFCACPTYRQSAHNSLCRAASRDPDLISLSVGTRSARRALRRVSRMGNLSSVRWSPGALHCDDASSEGEASFVEAPQVRRPGHARIGRSPIEDSEFRPQP